MLRRNQLSNEGPLGAERNQQELADSLYPEMDIDELIVTEHPAFMDLRRANIPLKVDKDGKIIGQPYTPQIIKDEDILAEFIAQTLKMRRGMKVYELSIVNHKLVDWSRKPTPKQIMSKTFTEIGKVLANLFWHTDGAVGIRISLQDGIEIGIYNSNRDDVEYDPYMKFQYSVNP